MKKITPKSIKAERKRREMTQTEFAEILGVTLRMYQYYEAGSKPIPPAREDSIRLRLGWLS